MRGPRARAGEAEHDRRNPDDLHRGSTPNDASQERVKKTSAGRITYYAGDLYQRVVTQGPPSTADHRYFIYAGGRVVAQVTDKRNSSGGQTGVDRWYLHDDVMGSIHTVTSTTSQVVAQDFTPFGQSSLATYALGIPFGFTGHEHDPEVGLINMKGRMYDPVLARFLTPDPFLASPLSTQGMNRYSYVFNDPLSFTDPSGFTSICAMRAHNEGPGAGKTGIKGLFDAAREVWALWSHASPATGSVGHSRASRYDHQMRYGERKRRATSSSTSSAASLGSSLVSVSIPA